MLAKEKGNSGSALHGRLVACDIDTMSSVKRNTSPSVRPLYTPHQSFLSVLDRKSNVAV